MPSDKLSKTVVHLVNPTDALKALLASPRASRRLAPRRCAAASSSGARSSSRPRVDRSSRPTTRRASGRCRRRVRGRARTRGARRRSSRSTIDQPHRAAQDQEATSRRTTRHRTQTGNRRGPDGERCPLHCAAARGHVECATALLIAGANPAETEKSSGRTCSELAEEGGHDRLAGMIRGAAAAADGWPLLMDGSPSSRRRVRIRLGTRKEGAFEPGEGAASIAHPAPCHTLSACRPTHAPHGQVVLGEKDFNKTRGKAFLIHSQFITEFCADFGVPTLMRGGVKKAKIVGYPTPALRSLFGSRTERPSCRMR